MESYQNIIHIIDASSKGTDFIFEDYQDIIRSFIDHKIDFYADFNYVLDDLDKQIDIIYKEWSK